MKYFITIEKMWYDFVEASNEDEAIEKALEKFDTCEPEIYLENEED